MLFNDCELMLALVNGGGNFAKSDYFCYRVLSSTSEKEAISYLRKLHPEEREFYRYLNSFIKKYNNHERVNEAAVIILDVYKKYLEDYGISKNTKPAKKELYVLDECEQILTELYLSGLSKEEYCFYNTDVNFADIRNLYNRVRKNDLTHEMINEIQARDFEEIRQRLLEIAFNILDGNYDYLDYFEHSKLQPADFIKTLSNDLPEDKLCKLKLFFNVRHINWNRKVNLEIELQSKNIIKGIEITPDMKQEVYDYMKEKNMPMSNSLFKYSIRKKVDNILEESQKIKIKN